MFSAEAEFNTGLEKWKIYYWVLMHRNYSDMGSSKFHNSEQFEKSL